MVDILIYKGREELEVSLLTSILQSAQGHACGMHAVTAASLL